MLRYLLPAKPKAARESFEEFAYEHVCSHDRRVEAVKRNSMVRNNATCRGILKEYWDRTEEQQRKSLHQHILEWWEPRAPQPGHVPIAPVPREVPGHNCQQRSMQCTATTTEPYQEDEMYYAYHVSRIWGELVRPNVANACKSSRWSGFGVEELRVAGLARAVQTTSYIHQCSSSYCLASGPNCRFFHTWPLQMQQQYDENTERVALQRRLPADDRRVVGHDLEILMFNTGQIHVGGFDPNINCDSSKRYACKYNAKPEKHFYLDVGVGPEDAAKMFLQCRTVGLPLAMWRLLGHKVVRCERPFVNIVTQFVAGSGRNSS